MYIDISINRIKIRKKKLIIKYSIHGVPIYPTWNKSRRDGTELIMRLRDK